MDLSDFLPQNVSPDDISSVRKTLGIREGDTAICFVGRLGKEKSIDTLIEFFAQNCKGNEQYKLFIIGDGPEKNNLAKQIQDLDVTSQAVSYTHLQATP